MVFKAWVSAIEGRKRVKNMIDILKSFKATFSMVCKKQKYARALSRKSCAVLVS